MAEIYDGLIIGAGHNGLVLGCYLAKAGLRVLAIDRRETVGGGLSVLDNPRHPGFLHNTHAFFLRALDRMPWYSDLELARHGAEMNEPELNVVLVTRDHETLEWWTDFERTRRSFARFSDRDAETLARWHEDFLTITERILIPEACSPPLPPERRRELLEQSPEGRRLLAVSQLSPLEFVTREIESPVIQAGLLFFNGLREVDLRVPGFGHHIAFLLANPAKAQMVMGGSAKLAAALEAAFREAGGEIMTGVEPDRIIVEDGRARGVVLADGERIRARHFVASSLNPQQTFLELLASEDLPTSWRERAEKFEYNLLAPLFALNLALEEPPRYRAAEKNPDLARAFMVILGLDHVDQFHDIIRCHEKGIIPPTVMWGACPTMFDPSQAPAGKHTAFMWEKLPYRLGGDAANWDAAAERHGSEMLELWCDYAPNLRGSVIDRFVRTPLDVERDFPNMRCGDLLIGAFTNDQIGYNRPFEGAGSYRARPDGLYLCGSSCHPGGNITGLPGYNAAQVLLADLGIAADWVPESFEQRLASAT